MKPKISIVDITTANDHVYIPYQMDEEEAFNEFFALLHTEGNMLVFDVAESSERIMVIKDAIQTVRIYPKPVVRRKELN